MYGWIQRRLSREMIRFTAASLFVVSLVVLGIWFARWQQGQTLFDRPLGTDFSALYLTGRLLNEYPHERYGDLALQYELYHEIFPDRPPDECMPSVISPYLGPLLQRLARLPYEAAYLVWLVLMLGVYVAGCRLLWSLRTRLPAEEWSTFLLIALAYQPFVMECWLNGQSSVLALFYFSLGLVLLDRNRPIAAGLAWSLLVYKPHFFVLLAPLLLIGRQWKVILGGVLGGVGLAAVSIAAIGWQGCLSYLGMILSFLNATGGSVFEIPTHKFVDLNQFMTFVFGAKTPLSAALAAGLGLAGFLLLARLWLRLTQQRQGQLLLISGTFALTPVLNIYMGVYETVIALPAAFLLADRLYQPDAPTPFPPRLQAMLMLLFCMPWLAFGVAQWMTPVLALLGIYVLRTAHSRAATASARSADVDLLPIGLAAKITGG